MSDDTPDKPERPDPGGKDRDLGKLDIDWVKTAAGALAAVSTAVLLSTLGAAGTLIGAALGSVAVTVSSELYTQGLARSRARMAKVQESALSRVTSAQAEVRRAARDRGDTAAVDSHLAFAEQRLDRAREDLGAAVDEPATYSWRDRLARLPWRRIAVLAAGLFLVVVVVITAFEVLAGRSVASYTGGSGADSGPSITRITGGGDGRNQDRERRPGPDDASGGPSTEQPGSGTTPEGPDDETEPSDEPTDQPTDEPTGQPTGQPTGDPTVPSPSEPAPSVPSTTSSPVPPG